MKGLYCTIRIVCSRLSIEGWPAISIEKEKTGEDRETEKTTATTTRQATAATTTDGI